MKLTDDLEHQIWKLLKEHHLDEETEFNLAISGGLDSMVLLKIFSVIRSQAKLNIMHFHHGSDEVDQGAFRDQAFNLVKSACEKYKNVHFTSEKSAVHLNSEDDLRQARWSFLRQHSTAGRPIVTAHHQDDWVETLTLKMLRGTSEQGFLAFQVWNYEILRPFLQTPKLELLRYAKAKNLTWCEDPSNQSTDYLRNWLRESWFKELEGRIPGSYHNFSRSLFHLASALNSKSDFKLQFYKDRADDGLDRAWFSCLSDTEQLKALALFLKKSGCYDMTRGQLEEIKKRLDKNQNDITFEIIRKWVINRSQIMLT